MTYATTQQYLTYTIEVLFILGLWIVVNGMVDCIIESWRIANMPEKIEIEKVPEKVEIEKEVDLTEMSVEQLINHAIDSGLIDKEISSEVVLEATEKVFESPVKRATMKKADYVRELEKLGLPTDGTVKVLKARFHSF